MARKHPARSTPATAADRVLEPPETTVLDLLDNLLNQQAHRLAYWRVAAEEINYRRFFDVNEMAAIRPELPEVFYATHDLLLRLFDEKMTELLAEAREAVDAAPRASEKLRRFIQLHLSLVERNPDLASVLIVELRQSAQFLKADGRQKLAAYLDVFGQIVRDGQEAGELDPAVSPQTVKRAIFGALDELALGWLMSGRRTSLKKTAAELSGWLVRGLANK